MYAMVAFSYSVTDRLKQFTREQYLDLQDKIPQLNLSVWKEGAAEAPYSFISDTLIDLATDGLILTQLGLEFTVKRFKGAYRVEAGKDLSSNTTYNLQVAIPAVGLLSMDEVELMADACTHQLADMLKQGWRIIAVCPPDAQRRPDYILGRSPEMRNQNG